MDVDAMTPGDVLQEPERRAILAVRSRSRDRFGG